MMIVALSQLDFRHLQRYLDDFFSDLTDLNLKNICKRLREFCPVF